MNAFGFPPRVWDAACMAFESGAFVGIGTRVRRHGATLTVTMRCACHGEELRAQLRSAGFLEIDNKLIWSHGIN
jgi:hypothetical protein